MLINLKEVKKCRNGAFGNFLLRGRESALITVSMKLNNTVAEYGATVLHEFLHLWVTILRRKGFRVSDRREHKFIYAVEALIFDMAEQYMKPRRKK